MLTYFGRVRFKGHLPGGLVAIALGTLLLVRLAILLRDRSAERERAAVASPAQRSPIK